MRIEHIAFSLGSKKRSQYPGMRQCPDNVALFLHIILTIWILTYDFYGVDRTTCQFKKLLLLGSI